MKGVLLLALLVISPANLEMPPNMVYACADGYSFCLIKKEALQELIHAKGPRTCWNRES